MNFKMLYSGRILKFTLPLLLGVCAAFGETTAKQTSSLTQTLDAYIATMSTPEAASGTGAYSRMQDQYLALFSAAQKPTAVRKATTADLHRLFYAASIVAFYAPMTGNAGRFVRDMVLDLSELQRRDAAYKSEFVKVYKSLIWERQLSRARQFYKNNVSHLRSLPSVPAYRSEVSNSEDRLPSEIAVGTTKDELIRRRVNVSKGPVIIGLVDPQCHFCASLNKDLRADPQLLTQLERHTIWLAPLGGVLQFKRLQRWNRAHPHEKIGVIYKPADWPMITVMAVPQLFFMKDGLVVQKIDGWPQGGHVNELEVDLRKIGLSVGEHPE